MTPEMTMRKIIRVDGTEEDLVAPITLAEARRHINAQGLDTVQLRHSRPVHVMLVDDTGAIDGKPPNLKATELYWLNCRPGTTHRICGDVVVVPDEDFA